jgi:hypothetical protein
MRQWLDEAAYFERTGELFPADAGCPGCPCAGTGYLGREWLEKREPQCTCGAGDPNDLYVFHAVDCDAVPCPFCPLEAQHGQG